MPAPKPNTGESREDFISRCMGDEMMVEEFEENDQRFAVCQDIWERNKPDSAKTFWRFQAATDLPDTGELTLYGPFNSDPPWLDDEITPKRFKQELDALGEIKQLRVMINSDGGDVFAGQAIHSMLARHPAKVTVYIDGLAASIASIVAMAGDTVIMPKNAMMMIHDPWTIGIGNARDFRKLADTLDHIRESMLAAYENKTQMERGKLINMLNAETWMTAEEAVEMGFADEIEESKKIAASLIKPGLVEINGQRFDISKFKNPPAWDAPARSDPTKRDIERALRDAGLSRDRAKAILATGWKESAANEPQEEIQRLYLQHLKIKGASNA